MFGIFADLLSSVLTILFPAFASYKALRSSDPSQLAPWLMYWVVLSGILLAESWTIFILRWLPFYSWLRLFFMAYLVLPQTQGAQLLYVHYVEPFLSHHEREIEELIGRAHERAKDLGLQYFYKAVDFIREKVLGLPPQRPAPPPPTGPAAYAQYLLSRFNLPSTAGASNLPSTGDWLSVIGSSLAAMASTGQGKNVQAKDASATGSILPREMENMSRSEKIKFISSQRELLGAIGSALTQEEMNLVDEDTASDESADATPLEKNRSDTSFHHVHPEDIPSSSAGRREPSQIRRESGGWTSGWFGYASGANVAGDQNPRSRA